MTETHQDLRDAIRALCATFPPEYHRKIDEARGYPEAFVDALTEAGWMAALYRCWCICSGHGIDTAGRNLTNPAGTAHVGFI